MLKTMIDEEQLCISNMSIEEISSIEMDYDKLTVLIKFLKKNIQLQYRSKKEMLTDLQLLDNLFQKKINQLNSVFTIQDKETYKQDIVKKHKLMSYIAIPVLYFVMSIAMMMVMPNILSAFLFSLFPAGFFYVLELHDYSDKNEFLEELFSKVKECNEKYIKSKKPLLKFIKNNITRLVEETSKDISFSSKLKEVFVFETLEKEEQKKPFVKRL